MIKEINPGMKLKGNVNNAVFEVIKIENYIKGGSGKTAIIQDCKTGKQFQYGVEVLKRCDLTILD